VCRIRHRFGVVEGCILNIESQEMKFHEWGMDVDPDESCWVESVKFNVSFLVVIRVFFELGFSACEEIGLLPLSIHSFLTHLCMHVSVMMKYISPLYFQIHCVDCT